MPIGSAKIGVLGAGLVPGGTQTFNASGTFTVPPGVKKVNITGRGGTGNPGNAGNSGNPGTPGNGAGGGSAGGGNKPNPCCSPNVAGGAGGAAIKAPLLNGLQYSCPTAPTWRVTPYPQTPAPLKSNKYTVGGAAVGSGPTPGIAGECGQAGSAGNAGTAGNPGNPGQASSGICKTFPGGAGGNAGVAGAAGNAGTGGTGGGGGTSGTGGGQRGTGGNGGGQGGLGANLPAPTVGGTGGGGGAGVTNSGATGTSATLVTQNTPQVVFSVAGGSGNPQVTFTPVCGGNDNYNASCTAGNNTLFPSPGMQGGVGAGGRWQPVNAPGGGFYEVNGGGIGGWVGFATYNLTEPTWNQSGTPGRKQINNYNNPCLRPEILRAGGGGGAIVTASGNPPSYTFTVGGGGGGGGRGNAGNAGGTSPTPSGSAGTPQTFNCVPVTPGAPYPITVGGPAGGQIVISWNPQ